MPGLPEGLPLLHEMGYRTIVIAGDPAAARSGEEVKDMFLKAGVPLEAFYRGGEPGPALIVRAADEHGIDTGNSWLIGESLDDVEAGRRAGVRTVLVNTGKETAWALSTERLPHHIVSDFTQATKIIASFDLVYEAAQGRRKEVYRLGELP